MAKRRVSKYEADYRKQVKRIKQFVRRAESRGYYFGELDTILPNRPKRLTAGSVRRLEAITPDKLYKRGVYGGEATSGEIISAELGRKEERKLAAQRAAKTRKLNAYDTEAASRTEANVSPILPGPEVKILEDDDYWSERILSNYRSFVRGFNEGAQAHLFTWLDTLIAKRGKQAVAEMLEAGAAEGVLVNYQIAYDEKLLTAYINKMLDYLPDIGEIEKEDILESIEEGVVYIEG